MLTLPTVIKTLSELLTNAVNAAYVDENGWWIWECPTCHKELYCRASTQWKFHSIRRWSYRIAQKHYVTRHGFKKPPRIKRFEQMVLRDTPVPKETWMCPECGIVRTVTPTQTVKMFEEYHKLKHEKERGIEERRLQIEADNDKFNKQNLRNMVYFHKDGLIKIRRGKSNSLDSRDAVHLKRLGILNANSTLTTLGEKLLAEIKSESKRKPSYQRRGEKLH
jgi:predicted RNA-binding Zn-ribbon protein involved in translation (DUF1610 family)